MTSKNPTETFEQILIRNPSDEVALFGLAMTYYRQGEFSNAKSVLNKLLSHNPEHATAHCNLAAIRWHLNEFDEGLFHAQKAIQLKPDFALAYRNCGLLYLEKNKFEEAHVFLAKAVKLDSKNPDMHCSLGRFHFCMRQYAQALQCFQQALLCDSKFAVAFLEIGNTYKAVGQYKDAVEAYETALQIKPDDAKIFNNLGTALQDLDEFEQARKAYQSALQLDPQNAAVLCHMAQLEEESGNLNEALKLVEASLTLDSKNIDAHLAKSLILFKLCEFAQAFEESEWRLKKSEYDYLRYYVQPLWEGQDLNGKTLLIHAEQGLGDELTFYSCLPDVLKCSGKVIVECDPRLADLLRHSFPEIRVVPRPKDNILHSFCVSDSKIDYQIPSGSLLKVFRRKRSDFPEGTQAFLKVPESLNLKWLQRLQALGSGLKIGISWTSAPQLLNPDSSGRSKGSTGLHLWRDVLGQKGVYFVNLQYGDVRNEIESCQKEFSFALQEWPDLDLKNDLSDIAALIENLDVVISVNTAVSILAASLGKTTWTLCDFANTTPKPVESCDILVPARVMIRQEKRGDWNSVFKRVANKLKNFS